MSNFALYGKRMHPYHYCLPRAIEMTPLVDLHTINNPKQELTYIRGYPKSTIKRFRVRDLKVEGLNKGEIDTLTKRIPITFKADSIDDRITMKDFSGRLGVLGLDYFIIDEKVNRFNPIGDDGLEHLLMQKVKRKTLGLRDRFLSNLTWVNERNS